MSCPVVFWYFWVFLGLSRETSSFPISERFRNLCVFFCDCLVEYAHFVAYGFWSFWCLVTVSRNFLWDSSESLLFFGGTVSKNMLIQRCMGLDFFCFSMFGTVSRIMFISDFGELGHERQILTNARQAL